MHRIRSAAFHLSFALFVASCFSCRKSKIEWAKTDPDAFSAYWDTGKAEISSYTITHHHAQSTQPGQALLIFLTEDFSKTTFVKPSRPELRPTDVSKALKLQSRVKLETGVSDVQLSFTLHQPVQFEKFGNSLKLATLQDDWSGQAYCQALWKGHRYEVTQHSYLEVEGDKSYSLVNCHLEEEIWTQIRLSPEYLPTGDIDIVPPVTFFRSASQPVKSYKAVGSFIHEDSLTTYRLEYPELKRKVEFQFGSSFPFFIRGWREWNSSVLVCEGILTHSERLDYWNFQKNEDRPRRTEWYPSENTASAKDSIIQHNQ